MKRFTGLIMLLAIISAAFLAVAVLVRSQSSPIQASASFDRHRALIGDAFNFYVKVSYDGRVGSVEMPDVEDKLSGFDILGRKTLEKRSFGKTSIASCYLVTCYDPSEYTIPKIEIRYQRKDGRAAAVSTGEASVTIKGVLKEEEKRRSAARMGGDLVSKAVIGAGKGGEGEEPSGPSKPVDSPIDYKIIDLINPFTVYTASELAIISASGVTAILFAVLAIFFIKRRMARRPVLSPFERAIKSLGELEAKGMAEKGMAKEFYFELSSILRDYLKIAFGVGGVELTTSEFTAKIKSLAFLNEGHKRDLVNLLELSDLVKYSDYVPQAKESRSSFDIGKRNIAEINALLQAQGKGS